MGTRAGVEPCLRGGVPHLMHVAYPEIKRVDYVVMCEYCGAETHTFKQREPAVKAWNRRVKTDGSYS